MSSDEATFDPAPGAAGRCPLCEQPNACAFATGGGVKCWCVDAVFDPVFLADIRESSRPIACLCAACAARHRDARRRGGIDG